MAPQIEVSSIFLRTLVFFLAKPLPSNQLIRCGNIEIERTASVWRGNVTSWVRLCAMVVGKHGRVSTALA